jgi:GT2 family glycosyltransferase
VSEAIPLPQPLVPRVSVVIPTWNGRELLLHALEALERQDYRDYEVVVVDNASSDGTVEAVRARHPATRLIVLPTNVGFAAGVNAGITGSRSEIVVLLNNDTEVEPGWLSALVEAFDRHPEVGICASKVLMFDDRARIDSAGDQLGLFPSQIGHGALDSDRFAEEREILSACAAAAAYRRAVFDTVGLFDERFFAYVEDVDLGVRAQLAGFRCLFVPGARVYHHASATSNRIPERKFQLIYRNSLIVFFQYMPLPRLLAFTPAMLAWPLVQSLASGHSVRTWWSIVRGVVGESRAILARRRQVFGGRRISRREFAAKLAPPFTRQPRIPSP